MKEKVQVSLYIPKEIAEAVNDYRFSERIESKNDAYISLLELALSYEKTLN